MKKKTYSTSATLIKPFTNDEYHTLMINGDIFMTYFGKPAVIKRENDYKITFNDLKLVWFVDRIYYHDLTKMREEAKLKTETLK